MAAQYKTPGVYVKEINGFSSSVVEVPTAIPAFIGYTERAQNGDQDLTLIPTQISSMVQFQTYYANSGSSGAPIPQYTYTSPQNPPASPPPMPPYVTDATGPRFNLYYSMEMFFNNGGGQCYIVSIGSYANVISGGGTVKAETFTAAMDILKKFTEPTMLVMPDAMLLSSVDDWKTVSQNALTHCNYMQCRVAILDVFKGYLPQDGSANDPITGFYTVNGLGEDFNKYGVAYYPWINTGVIDGSYFDFSWLSAATLPTLQTDLETEAPIIFPPNSAGTPNPNLAPYLDIVKNLKVAVPGSATYSADLITETSNSQTILAVSPLYQQTMKNIALSANLLPPSGAMAGVYTRNDNTFGVYQSPANTTIISANSPAVIIDDAEQQGLNVPLNGLAVNAIRTFPNYGLLVWGARTMAGNSNDWRYISVRRTMIMLEQSIKAAMQAYVFQSNDDLTWVAVNSTISNFLISQWKDGALVGAKSSDAFSVAVGLGVTMTGDDILNGLMNVSVGVAVVRPAEFIVLTFQQQMQTS